MLKRRLEIVEEGLYARHSLTGLIQGLQVFRDSKGRFWYTSDMDAMTDPVKFNERHRYWPVKKKEVVSYMKIKEYR